jgi:outer membrane biosynthesis protein TonB
MLILQPEKLEDAQFIKFCDFIKTTVGESSTEVLYAWYFNVFALAEPIEPIEPIESEAPEAPKETEAPEAPEAPKETKPVKPTNKKNEGENK